MSAPVFVSGAAAEARIGDVIAVTGDEARHAVAVQRRELGETVDVVDGTGRRARGTIAEASRDRMMVRVESITVDDDPEVVLVQALAKGGRDEQAVEAAIELGATRIVPWAASRCIVQWRGDKAEKARAKWESLVVAATKQSRRARIAGVDAQVTTPQLAGLVRDATAGGDRVLVLHESARAGVAALTWSDARSTVWIVVGPEGGISDGEVQELVAAGAEAVMLGPHVLRASTAGPAALAALAIARGTWAPRDAADDQGGGGIR